MFYSERTVDDIFREMTDLERKMREKDRRVDDDDGRAMSGYHSSRSHSSASPRSHSRGERCT